MGIGLSFFGVLVAFFEFGQPGAVHQSYRIHVGITVAIIDILILALAYLSIMVWAPRTKSADFVRTFALTAAVIALGGITVCSGAFTS